MARKFDLTFNDEQETVLAQLIGKDKNDIDTEDIKSLIHESLSYVQYSVAKISEGKIMASVDEEKKSYREVEMPVFEKFKIKK